MPWVQPEAFEREKMAWLQSTGLAMSQDEKEGE